MKPKLMNDYDNITYPPICSPISEMTTPGRALGVSSHRPLPPPRPAKRRIPLIFHTRPPADTLLEQTLLSRSPLPLPLSNHSSWAHYHLPHPNSWIPRGLWVSTGHLSPFRWNDDPITTTSLLKPSYQPYWCLQTDNAKEFTNPWIDVARSWDASMELWVELPPFPQILHFQLKLCEQPPFPAILRRANWFAFGAHSFPLCPH